MTTRYIGQPLSRVDGRAKVTGSAKYAAEFKSGHILYGYIVSSTIARGKIKSIDAEAALALKGVVQIFTHENRPRTAWFDRSHQDEIAPPGSPFRPLYDRHIVFSGQPMGLVVADSFELARYAASLVKVEYEAKPPRGLLSQQRDQAYVPKERNGISGPAKARGDADKALASAAAKIQAQYSQHSEHHNPMENHASTVIYENDGSLTVYDKTQGVQNTQSYLLGVFDLPAGQVRVLSHFVGGAFGSALRPQYQLFLAVMAAMELKRSVRVSMTRQQMFTHGHRPAVIQNIAIGATESGIFQAITHEALSETSTYEDYSENVVNWSGLLYQCDNVKLGYKVAQLDLPTPCDMRAPGSPTGLWALESAIDELAYQLKIDPLEIRLKNYTDRDPIEDKPFSSKALRECYQQGAEAFGWSKRSIEPRSMKDGKKLVGWGMATGVWEAMYNPFAARAVFTADGRLEVSSATADIGTGTYTVMSQIAAQTLGLPMDCVTFKLGDSSLPQSPVEGGSWTAASCGSAVKDVCEGIGAKLLTFASQIKKSPLADAKIEDVEFVDESIVSKMDPSKRVTLTAAMREGGVAVIEEQTTSRTSYAAYELKQRNYSCNTHCATFVEVKVDEDLGSVRVTRAVSAVAAGKILNPKTAGSQILGALVWGIGMALHEEGVVDPNHGRVMNHNLAEYHIPVNADVGDLQAIFVEERDDIVNPLGIKGVGEIGICGAAAAIGNAIFHATGRRVRSLPITLDKVLGLA